VGNREGCFRAYSNESEDHIDKKYLVWKKLKKAGYKIYCEARFKNNIRPDLLVFKGGYWKIIEILKTETDEELAEKIKKYPDIEIIGVKTYKDIKELEL